MISDNEIRDCSRMKLSYRRQDVLTEIVPILQDYAQMLGFGEHYQTVTAAIKKAQAAILEADGCTNCEFYHECHK